MGLLFAHYKKFEGFSEMEVGCVKINRFAHHQGFFSEMGVTIYQRHADISM